MKVLLAHRAPDELADDVDAATLPAGLRSMAARLRKDGIDASVANFSRLPWKQVERFLADALPDVVGISSFTFNRSTAVRLARLARRARPEALIVLGGPHASALPDIHLKRVREIDAVAVGEGEETLAETCRRRAAGASLLGVPGLAVRGRAATTARQPLLETLPRPVLGIPGAGLEPARDFRFIVASRPRADGPERRSPESVAAEMRELGAEFGLIEAAVVGPGLVDAEWLTALADAIGAAGCTTAWELSASPEDLGRLPRDERLERALFDARGAGLRLVRYVLDDARAAGIPSAVLAEAAGTLRSAGVGSRLTLRIGSLNEGLGSRWLDAMRGVIRALRPQAGDAEPRELLPGTPDWDIAAAEESLDDTYWMEEDRAVVPLAGEAAVERASAALHAVYREVAREAQPGPRDLDALEARGAGAWTHLEWGDFRAARGDADEAERRYRLAAQLEPGSPFPWLRLAALFRRGRGDAEREAAALTQALQRTPRHAPARARLDEIRSAKERARPGRGSGARRPRDK